jgi:TolA-binding protein
MNTETSLISFSSKIQQLEERQNITAKYTVGVKRQLDELTGKFNELQQRFEKQLTLNNSLNGTKPTNGLALNVPEVNADNAANEIDPAETDAIAQQEQSIPVFSD